MRSDLDDALARETTGLLLGQQAAYMNLLESLEQEPAAVAVDTERLRLLAASAGRILAPLRNQSTALAGLSRRLDRPDCAGPRAEAARQLLAEVGARASAAKIRLDNLIGALRADQNRTLERVNALDRDTPSAYQEPSPGRPMFVDRTG